MKAVINDYHIRIFGNSVTDTTTYTERDTIAVQVRNEKNGNKINTRSILEKTKSNRALTERNVLNDHLENEKKTPYSITDTLYTGYYEGEAIKVSNVVLADHIVGGDVEYDAFPKTAAVYTTANANGAITSVQGALPSDPDPTVLSETFRHFVSNSQDCIVFKESAKGRNYYFYAEKRPGKTVLMAYFGDLPEDIKIRLNKTGKAALNTERPAVINIDINHQAISPQYPPAMPSDYRVTSELTYNQLAEELNYTGYGEAIAHANQADGETLIKINTLVKIPPLYFEIAETAWNGSLPSIDRIIGSLYPSMPTPHLRMKDHSVPFNWVETFIEAAALVAIMCFAPELLAGVMGATLGSATVASTASLAVTAASYGGAAAIASTVDQGIAIGYGSRHGFDVKAIAISAVTAAVTAGVGQQLSQFNFAPSIFRGTVTGNVISNVVKAEGIAFAQQAVLVTTRLQKHFDWKALSAAAFNAVISTGTNAAFGADSAHAIIPMNKITYAGTDVLVNTVSNAALHHQRLSAEGLSASILGNMAGTYAGNKALDGILAMQQETLQVERMGEVGHERAKVGQQRRTANQHTMFAKTAAKTEKARNNPVKEVKAAKVTQQRKATPAWQGKYQAKAKHYLSTKVNANAEKNTVTNQNSSTNFVEGLRKNVIKAYKDPANWSSASIDKLSEVSMEMSTVYKTLGSDAVVRGEQALNTTMEGIMAAEVGTDINLLSRQLEGGMDVFKAGNELAKDYQHYGNYLSKFSLLAKRSIFALDVLDKSMDVIHAPSGQRGKTAFIKSAELAGEAGGAFLGGAIASELALGTMGVSLVATPAIVVGTTATGGYVARQLAERIENKYDSIIQKWRR